MNYWDYPPGLNRRLAYSNYLNTRRNNMLTIYNPSSFSISPLRNNRSRRIDSILTVYNSPVLSITPLRNVNRNVDFNYDFLSNLQDVKVGLISKNLLEKTSVKNTEKEDNLCVICQDVIDKYDIVREIDCNHEFHIDCIDNWFIENKKCPICKFEI